MENFNIKVTKVEMTNGFVHESTRFNDKKYGNRALYQSTTIAKCLRIEYVNDKEETGYFFTPSAMITCVDGFLNYKSLQNPTPWFKEMKGEMKGHKNILSYPGSTEPSTIIEDRTEIVPTIVEGMNLEIRAAIKKITISERKVHLFRVKLIKVL